MEINFRQITLIPGSVHILLESAEVIYSGVNQSFESIFVDDLRGSNAFIVN